MTDFDFSSTIAAIATAPGDAAVGILRISGKEALSLAAQIFQFDNPKITLPQAKPRFFYLGTIVCQGAKVDHAMLVKFHGPKSYTGEDLVELHCHGGYRLLNFILAELLEKGAKLATPGEFTKRAFLHGKIDLTQAEAIQSLIKAPSLEAAQSAYQNVNRKLFQAISLIKKEISLALAWINASIDFSEEGHTYYESDALLKRLESAQHHLSLILKNSDQGVMLHKGCSVVLLGMPNAGKSSLFNALLQTERAIVHSIPGTTRDIISAAINLKGLEVTLSDTAGIRNSSHPVEQEGIKRSVSSVQAADLVLWVVDITNPNFNLPKEAEHKKILLVFNKIDLKSLKSSHLPKNLEKYPYLAVSSVSGEGLDGLLNKIFELLIGGDQLQIEQSLILNLRQKNAASLALEGVNSAIERLQTKASEEMIAEELHHASFSLNDILGAISPEEILDEIFQSFCIGK